MADYNNNTNKITFNGSGNDDTMTNTGNDVTIKAAAGDDYIVNSGSRGSIDGSGGKDTIINQESATNILIQGAENDDTIVNYGSNLTICGDYNTATDSITNYGSYVLIKDIVRGGSYSGAAIIINEGSNVTINSGKGNDTISNSGSNVTIDGGAGNDTIYNNAASNVTINTSEGNDIIKLGASVQSFRAEGFGAGDVIELATATTNLEKISGGIKAGNVSIIGVNNIVPLSNSWSTSSNSIVYNQTAAEEGAQLDGNTIIYANAGTSGLFTISGITSTVGVSLSGNEVTLNAEALNGITGTVSISGDYKLVLASDVDTVAENTSGWTTLSNGNVAYFESGKGSYYSLSSDGKSVSYIASVAGSNNAVVLSGVKGTPTLSGSTVNLNANNFNDNVGVVSNAGNYQFSLSGDFDGKKFTGTSGADTITNSGANLTIDGGNSDDSITNSGANVSIVGGNDIDTINSSGENVTIIGGEGADKISLGAGADSNLIYAQGNDTIYGFKADSTLSIAGGDSLSLGSNYLTLKAAYNFLVSLSGSLISLPGAYLSLDSVNINGTDHKLVNMVSLTSNADDVEISRDLISVRAFAGDDSILLSGSHVQLDGGDDNDSITISGNGNLVKGGDGKDFIIVNGDTNSIAGEDGNDTITVSGDRNSIVGGEKNDLISLTASAANNTIQYNDGDGDDTIYGVNSTTVLKIGDGETDTYSSVRSNDDLVLLTGNGKMTLVGAVTLPSNNIKGKLAYFNPNISLTSGDDATINNYSEVTINALAGNDTIQNTGRNVFIDDGADNDLTYNFATNVTIAGGDGNDTIINPETASSVSLSGDAGDDLINNWGNTAEVSGSEGNDTIQNAGDFVSISGGDGDDSINNWGTNVTINTGAGNDKIYGNGLAMVYVYTSGNDTIRSFSDTSTLVTDGYEWQTLNTDNGCLVNLINGESIFGSIFLQDYLGKVNFTSVAAGIETISAFNAKKDGDTVTGTDDKDTIASGFASVSISAGAEDDSIISSGNYTTINAGNDKISVRGSSVSINGGAGDDSIKARVSSSTLRAGAGDDTVDFTNSTGNNLLVYRAGYGSDSIYNFNSSDTISIAGGAYNSVVSGNSLILTVGEDSITVYDAAWLSTINTASPVTVASDVDDIISFGRTKAVQITGNAKANLITGGTGADTLNGAAGNDTLTGGKGKDLFIYRAGNDTITDYATGERISLGSAISDVDIDDNNVVLATSNGSLTIVDGYKVRRYSGNLSTADRKIAFATGKSSTTHTFGKHKIFDRNKTAITLTAGATDSTLTDLSSSILSKLKTIDASNSALKNVTGNSKANKIYASSSGATLNGAKGKDTLYGGDGADVFVYVKNSGKDVIVDYAAGDVISLGAGATIDDILTKKTDVIFKVGSKKNVVKDAAKTTITFSENGTIKTFSGGVLYNSDKTSATVSSNLTTATTISSAIIDASTVKKAVNITGNGSANSIVGGKRNDTLYGAGGSDTLDGGKGNDKLYGGNGDDYLRGDKGKDSIYGGAGNDTIIGGKGNDSLWGDAGADEFIFSKGDGSDVIFGFDDNDTLTLDKVTIKKSTVNKNADTVTLRLSNGSITFKEFTATNFHIGKDTYAIEDGSFVKK